MGIVKDKVWCIRRKRGVIRERREFHKETGRVRKEETDG